MATRKIRTPSYEAAAVARPYMGEYSALAQQLTRRQPVYSVGQGLVNLGSDLAAAYFDKKADQKEEEKAKAQITNANIAERFLTDPTMSSAAANYQAGSAPMPTVPQQLFSGPASPQERMNATTSMFKGNPEMLQANQGRFADLAQQFVPSYQSVDGIGLVKMPGGQGGAPEVALGIPQKAQDPKRYVVNGALVDESGKEVYRAPKDAGTERAPTVQEFFDEKGSPYKAQYVNGQWVKVGGSRADTNTSAPPSGFREGALGPDGKPTLEPIPGGPADIGQKGLPQKYKDATAGLNTLKATVNKFKAAFEKNGTELFNTEGAGDMDSKYAQILFGVKNAEQTGALDKGSVDVIQGMLKKPTGLAAGVTLNKYFDAQIKSVVDYIDQRRKDLDNAYKNQGVDIEGIDEPPSGVDPEDWAYMTPEQKALFGG